MIPAYEVARYLVFLAANDDEPDFLTHMRLQKLLYYVQGWSLALRGEPMFPERIEAWAHGPVVRDLYREFAAYRDRTIQPETMGWSPIGLDEAVFIQQVWDAYKGYSASSLRDMTHSEPPWIDARGDLGPADRCDAEITQEAMHHFFTSQAE